jgi:purine-binding chemotaxis protein CheW
MSARLCCTCHVGGLLLGIEIDRVQEVLRHQTVTPVPLAGHGVSGLLNLRGRIVTVVDVRELLGLPPRTGHEDAVHVVIRTDAEVASLVVDAAGDVVDVGVGVIDQVPPTVDRRLRSYLSGAFQLDGTLLLLLETDRVTAALVGSGASL